MLEFFDPVHVREQLSLQSRDLFMVVMDSRYGFLRTQREFVHPMQGGSEYFRLIFDKRTQFGVCLSWSMNDISYTLREI